jgi:uncharacterized peroxidase-related enzyme
MTYIEMVADDRADAATAQLVAEVRAARGYVPNFVQLLGQRPAVYRAWRGLIEAVMANMDLRRYELATIAAAGALHSPYCLSEHALVLREKFYDAETVAAIATDHTQAGLSDVDVAVMNLAERVARDPESVDQPEIDRLRAAGLTDVEILDVALASAARCFFSTMLTAMGVPPDPTTLLRLEPGLREAVAGPSGETATGLIC